MTAGRYRFASFVLDRGQGRLLCDGAEVALRPKPLALLGQLVANAGRVVTKDELMAALWPQVVVTEDSLTRCVSEARAALGEAGHGAIRTLSKRGYLFALPVYRQDDGDDDDARTASPAEASGTPAREPVGRADDLARLHGLLDAERVVSVVGPGGVGKSCLAQWLLHERRPRHAHGAAWVDVAAVGDAELMASAIGTALRLPTSAGVPQAALLAALLPLDLLLVLDNAELFAAPLAALVQAIHAAAPRVRVLVTSQAPLQLAAEATYRLGPLDVAAVDATPGEAMRSGALQLFLHRASAADARFMLDDDDVRVAAALCRRLGGLPLSIELAAARAPTLGLAALAEMLDVRLLKLGNRRHDAPARQQSLHAAIAWSHGLLDDDSRRVFRRFGAFAGAFDLAAAEAVASGDGLDEARVAECLDALVDRSLVATEACSHGLRYRLLETTRAFALARLAEHGELEGARQRHVAVFDRRLGAAYDAFFRGPPSIDAWRDAAMMDFDDGRAALDAAAADGDGDGEHALGLAASLALIISKEQPQQRRRFLALAAPFADMRALSLRAARWAVEMAYDIAMTRPPQALQHALPALVVLRAAGDTIGLHRALSIVIYCKTGEATPAQHDAFAEMRAIERHDWPAIVLAQGAYFTACWYSARGDYDAAIERRRASYALYVRAGDSWRVLIAQANLMDSLLAGGRVDEAIACGQALEAKLSGTRQRAAMPNARLNLAAALLARGDVEAARPLAREGWAQATQLGWQPYWADYLALLAALEGRAGAAARVLGYADARYAAEGAAREVNELRATDRADALAVAQLGAEAAAQLRREGRGASDADVALAVWGEAVG